MSSGDPNCGLCRGQRSERWSDLPEIKSHADDGCPYCANMLEGLLWLIPDLEAQFGEDATFRFTGSRGMRVYADPNGSLRDTERNEAVELEYRWFMVDQPQPYETGGDTKAEASFERARGWIGECMGGHKLVLDLGEGLDGDSEEGIKLVETAAGQEGKYISLSHSWGAAHKVGIALADLPQTFRDAVVIARRLGIHYLWIDSLCILQDSASDWEHEASRMASVYRNSWLTVYATASSSPSSGIFRTRQAVWIQADEPEDAETLDILFPEAAKLRQDLRLSLRFKPIHPDFSPYADPLRQVSSLPLLSRAWGYQERLLAPRVLHFGPQELFWECMQTLDCDCGGIKLESQHMGSYLSRNTTAELPPKVSHYAALHVGSASLVKSKPQTTTAGKPSKRHAKLLSRWQELIQEYTHRSLTFSSDRLPAFSGVAAEMLTSLALHAPDTSTTTYHAGIWRDLLPLALLFERDNTTQPGRISIVDPRPAPSWSWASVDAPVRFLVDLAGPPAYAKTEISAEVIELVTVPAGEDVRGSVKMGGDASFLVLECPCVVAWVCVAPDGYMVPGKAWKRIGDVAKDGKKGPVEGKLGLGSFAREPGHEPLTFVPDVRLCDEKGQWLWEGEGEVVCARVMQVDNTGYWLVLRRVEGTGEVGEVYERIGLAKDHDGSWEGKGARKQREMKKVRIV
ncbi:heterokaryon incompatibility protein-domain-containing protein [Chaetomium sp. MPI-SDFR-AT-0129]|nr:heterokaryon incompatibility protein-domain-containing protein [Chaetomium sp. MPI-SDFR-AT-0129]